MKKNIIYIALVIIVISFIITIIRVSKTNKKTTTKYKTEQLKKEDIVKKVVATGSIIPQEEIDIKPQISGIINKIHVKEGQKLKKVN